MTPISKIKEKLYKAKGRRQQLKDQYFLVQKDKRRLNNDLDIAIRTQAIIQIIAKRTQKQLERDFRELSTIGLSSVFEHPCKLVFRFEGERTVKCIIKLDKYGYEEEPEASGGGYVNVASLTLHGTALSLADPPRRKILFIDEPFLRLKGNDENIRALELIKQISKETDTQIIMIADERIDREDIMENSDKVFKFELVNNVTKVRELK